MASCRSHQSGFTLVELLIVVVILAILATILVPQFSNDGQSAKSSNVLTELQIIRVQLQYYASQHVAGYPTVGQMWTNMTSKTNLDGTTTGTPTIGPFLQQAPVNPFTGVSTVVDGSVTTAGSATTGWLYNANTGNVVASVPAAQATLLGMTTNDVATY
jgi:general secretion pathway protein G